MNVADTPNAPSLLITAGMDPEGGLRLRLEGVLDGSGAYQLRDRLISCQSSGGSVTVDFSRLREASDFAVAVLAMYLAEHADDRIKLAGVRNHTSRILRAFGVNEIAA